MTEQPITEDKVRTEEKTGRSAWLGTAGWYPLLILFGLNMTDELDRSAFSVLLPEIRDHFGLDNSGILWVVAVAGAVALLLTVPIAQLADRSNRVRIALGGAALWAAFSLGTGFALSMWMLVIMRSGAAVGQAVVFPTHNSLLADYYPIASRPKVYSIHRAANSIGTITGLLVGAGLASAFGWRAPFLVFAVPTLLLVVVGFAVAAVVVVRLPLPQTDGTMHLSGLIDEVKVARNEQGVPQIYADNTDDLFFAQGFVQAQDRFWQMDVGRHLASGRLSELFGASTLKSDELVRAMGWRRVAEKEYALLAPETRDYLAAFADGVNAYLSDHSPTTMSVE